MAATQCSILLSMSSSTYYPISCSLNKINGNLNKPTVPQYRNLSQDINTSHEFPNTISSKNCCENPITTQPCSQNTEITAAKLYTLLEAVADRVEMHANIGEQRDNWNSLLLNSINKMTLTATAMVGLTAVGGAPQPVFALKLSSTVMFAAATGVLMVVNKLQPSQLVEEQRNAKRLFKQIQDEIQTMMALHECVTELDIDYMVERVLALDRAYPLPLIGVMLEKFPAKLEPAVWWPLNQFQEKGDLVLKKKYTNMEINTNGWTGEMENEMREVVHWLRRKDKQEYIKLGSRVLNFNKTLSILGPFFTVMAAVGSAFSGSSSFGMAVAVGAGALSTIVNSIEHGGQVGMVFEMYRNCAGYYQLLEESIESSIGEGEPVRRENGELVEMKVALQLGRRLTELKGLATASREHGKAIDEFASKLF